MTPYDTDDAVTAYADKLLVNCRCDEDESVANADELDEAVRVKLVIIEANALSAEATFTLGVDDNVANADIVVDDVP